MKRQLILACSLAVGLSLATSGRAQTYESVPVSFQAVLAGAPATFGDQLEPQGARLLDPQGQPGCARSGGVKPFPPKLAAQLLRLKCFTAA